MWEARIPSTSDPVCAGLSDMCREKGASPDVSGVRLRITVVLLLRWLCIGVGKWGPSPHTSSWCVVGLLYLCMGPREGWLGGVWYRVWRTRCRVRQAQVHSDWTSFPAWQSAVWPVRSRLGVHREPQPTRKQKPGLQRCGLQRLRTRSVLRQALHHLPPFPILLVLVAVATNQAPCLTEEGGWAEPELQCEWLGCWSPHILLQDHVGDLDRLSPVCPRFSAQSCYATPVRNTPCSQQPILSLALMSTGICLCPCLCWWPPTETLSGPGAEITRNLLGKPELRSSEGVSLVPQRLVLCFLFW